MSDTPDDPQSPPPSSPETNAAARRKVIKAETEASADTNDAPAPPQNQDPAPPPEAPSNIPAAAEDAPPAALPNMAIDFEDIRAAYRRIKDKIVRTPLVEHPLLNSLAQGRVLMKLEMMQPTGSFKIRGACNRLLQLTDEEKQRGVMAWSSGNHAQAIALVARMVGTKATIVMPHDAPTCKMKGARQAGAEIIIYHRRTEDREAIGRKLAAERQSVLVPSFDDPHIIAGQGTCGFEIAQDLHTRDLTPDQTLVPASGGGLAAGIAVAMKTAWPEMGLHTVEPEGFADIKASLVSGRREHADLENETLCDALMAPQVGSLTWPILHHYAGPGLAVSDAEAKAAMQFAFKELKLVLEPGGAVALAAILSRKLPTQGKTTVIVLSGGNLNADFFGKVIAAGA